MLIPVLLTLDVSPSFIPTAVVLVRFLIDYAIGGGYAQAHSEIFSSMFLNSNPFNDWSTRLFTTNNSRPFSVEVFIHAG